MYNVYFHCNNNHYFETEECPFDKWVFKGNKDVLEISKQLIEKDIPITIENFLKHGANSETLKSLIIVEFGNLKRKFKATELYTGWLSNMVTKNFPEQNKLNKKVERKLYFSCNSNHYFSGIYCPFDGFSYPNYGYESVIRLCNSLTEENEEITLEILLINGIKQNIVNQLIMIEFGDPKQEIDCIWPINTIY